MKPSAGNALFIILIALALFAALSYAVTNSTRNGAGVDKERTSIAVSELLQYANSMSNAVTRLQLINKCKDEELSWESDDWGHTLYQNSSSPADGSCEIFNPNGGAVVYQDLSELIASTVSGLTSYPTEITGKFFIDTRRLVLGVGGDALNAGNTEILLRAQVTENVCTEINKKFRGLSSIPSDGYPYWSDGGWTVNPAGQQFLGVSSRCLECEGKQTMCFLQTGGANNVYQFYHVLVIR